MENKTQQTNWPDEIIAMAGYWEPIAFMVRGGRGVKGMEQDPFPYSEAMAQKLARIGINMATWHYYKGLGIETEEEEMQKTATFFDILRQYGIRKSVYINLGSFFADTFPVENPEAEKWLSLDQFGMPPTVHVQHRICRICRQGSTQSYKGSGGGAHPV